MLAWRTATQRCAPAAEMAREAAELAAARARMAEQFAERAGRRRPRRRTGRTHRGPGRGTAGGRRGAPPRAHPAHQRRPPTPPAWTQRYARRPRLPALTTSLRFRSPAPCPQLPFSHRPSQQTRLPDPHTCLLPSHPVQNQRATPNRHFKHWHIYPVCAGWGCATGALILAWFGRWVAEVVADVDDREAASVVGAVLQRHVAGGAERGDGSPVG